MAIETAKKWRRKEAAKANGKLPLKIERNESGICEAPETPSTQAAAASMA
jgi:hypothetical protein